MRLNRGLLGTLLLGLSLPVAGAIAADEPSSAPVTAPQVWLSGAFGRVPGADPAAPAGAAPGGAPLDTWIREAPLTLDVGVPFEDLLELTVTSRPFGGDGPEERLSGGATTFPGPSAPGMATVTASLVTEPYGSSQHAWLLLVPEREGGPEALLDMPGPTAVLTSGSGAIPGEPGNGCFLYLCVDVGYRPPPATLEPLRLGIGETPSLSLDDGSALTSWTGRLTPLEATPGSERTAEADYATDPQSIAELRGLEPGGAGDWLLEIRIDLDRERGWQWFLYRLQAG